MEIKEQGVEIKEQGVEIKEPRIEVRELRIGNSVLFGEEIVKIAGISPTGLLDGKQYVTITGQASRIGIG